MKCHFCKNESGDEVLCPECREKHNAKFGLPLSYMPEKATVSSAKSKTSKAKKKPYDWLYLLVIFAIVAFLVSPIIPGANYVAIILGAILIICLIFMVIGVAQDVDEIKQILLRLEKTEQESER